MNATANAPGETHTLTCGNSRADAWLYRAARAEAPCVLVFPALGTPARPYQRLAAALQAGGVHALIADWRGMASSSVRARRGVDWGYLDLVDGEAQAMLTLAARELPHSALHSLGHSLGGQVALMHAARHPDAAPCSVILAASASPHHRAYPFPYRLLVLGFAWVAAAMSSTLGVFRGDWLRFGGAQGATLMREWSHFNRCGRLPPLGAERWDTEPALERVRLPVFVLSMAGDRFAPTPAALELAAKTRGKVQLARLDVLPSGRAPGHFDWMREPEAVVTHVLAWLASPAADRR